MKKIVLLGGLMIDHYMYVDHYPMRGGDCIVEKEADYIGGCPYNVANALRQLNFDAMIYSHLFNDSQGQKIKEHLINNNFNTTLCIEDEGKTGTCNIILDYKRERTFFSSQGNEGVFNRKDFTDDLIKDINYVYLSGIYLTYKNHNKEIIDFLKELHALDKIIIFNVSPMVASLPKDDIIEILSLCNIIKANKEEYSVIHSYVNPNEQIILVTDGANGSTIYNGQYSRHHEAYCTNTLDSNGAGDNFLAGFIYAYDLGFNHTSCLDIASACGSLACEHIGTGVQITLNDIQLKVSGQ